MGPGADSPETVPDAAGDGEIIYAEVVRPTPIAPHERIEVVDVIRGFALFGILTVNMYWFANPLYLELTGEQPWSAPIDRVVGWLISFFSEGKFYSLFSFLFGFGMAMQMARTEARGLRFGGLYARRLLVLLLIGLCHVVFLWAGDILVAYALVGFALLLFRRRAQTTLIVWALICLSALTLLMLGLMGLQKLHKSTMPTSTAPAASAASAPATAPATQPSAASADPASPEWWDPEAWTKQAYETYAQGTYGEILLLRVREFLFTLGFIMLFFVCPSILGMFLFGLYAGRRGVLHAPSAHLGFIRQVALWGLVLGVTGNLVMVVAMEFVQANQLTWTTVLLVAAGSIGAPALCFFYAAGIVLLCRRDPWRHRLRPLAAVGRMALSNYLLQSVVCTLIFNGYGLGLYGKVGPALGLALTIVIYAAQVPLSNWWLGRFRFGPAEWLWRSLTYRRPQPMRLTSDSE